MKDLTIAALVCGSIIGGGVGITSLENLAKEHMKSPQQRWEESQRGHLHNTKLFDLHQGKRQEVKDFQLSNGRAMPLEVEYRGQNENGMADLYINGKEGGIEKFSLRSGCHQFTF